MVAINNKTIILLIITIIIVIVWRRPGAGWVRTAFPTRIWKSPQDDLILQWNRDRACREAALTLSCCKKRYLASPGLLEPAFLLGSGWQIHHNKAQRPKETAYCRNEPTAAGRSPGIAKEKGQFSSGTVDVSWTPFTHSVVRVFLSNFTGKALITSHLRFSWASWSVRLVPISFPTDQTHVARLIFLKQSLDHAISVLRNP